MRPRLGFLRGTVTCVSPILKSVIHIILTTLSRKRPCSWQVPEYVKLLYYSGFNCFEMKNFAEKGNLDMVI